ncbi:MAG: SDR family oxidoreductase [Rhodospirillaceae bacterium]|nr:SDR family oxidoreductase [Rhodospirillales bacterium]
MSTILVTGGFGYVGGRLAARLLADGHHVRIATRRAAAPAWAGDAELVTVDWRDGLGALCQGVDTVLHLAAMSEVDAVRDPVMALDINAVLTVRLLEAAMAAGVRRFVYFSTAHVYGAPLAGTITETTLPRPVHPYAITHRTAEDFVLAAHDAKRIQGLVVRLSNVIGAPADNGAERWTLLVNDLCRTAVTNGRMVMRSSGMQHRDFVPQADVEAAIVHLLATDDWGDGLFNLGLGRSMTVRHMAELVASRAAALGITVPLDCPPPALGENAVPLDYRIDKLRATGFAPRGDIMAAVDETLVFCRDHFSRDVR